MVEQNPAAGDGARWRRLGRVLRGHAEDAPRIPTPEGELPTAKLAATLEDPSSLRLFGSPYFFRLWLAQVVSSLGDWIGLVAVIQLAGRLGKSSSPEAAIGIVMIARMLPGLFLASVGGVLVDRLDRRKVMVTCDIGRGLVLATLPFLHHVWQLFFASLLLEVLTLLWTPAKEASVPNLVRPEQLTTANSMSLAAAYGTFPIGSALFALLAYAATELGKHTHSLHFLKVDQESLAIYADVLTFFLSAYLISTLRLPDRHADRPRGRINLGGTFTDAREGWRFIRHSAVVRAVMIGLGTGLVGGGMVVPLGTLFSIKVLGAGAAGFGLLLTALGVGVGLGMLGLAPLQKRLPRERIFPLAVLLAGVFMFAAATASNLALTMAFVGGMGVSAGAVYVVGYALLQETVDDEFRGRIFATLYTVVRFSLLIALTVAPLLAGLLDNLSRRAFNGSVDVAGVTIALPGVRLTLWLGGLIIVLAGVLAFRTLRDAAPAPAPSPPSA